MLPEIFWSLAIITVKDFSSITLFFIHFAAFSSKNKCKLPLTKITKTSCPFNIPLIFKVAIPSMACMENMSVWFSSPVTNSFNDASTPIHRRLTLPQLLQFWVCIRVQENSDYGLCNRRWLFSLLRLFQWVFKSKIRGMLQFSSFRVFYLGSMLKRTARKISAEYLDDELFLKQSLLKCLVECPWLKQSYHGLRFWF